VHGLPSTKESLTGLHRPLSISEPHLPLSPHVYLNVEREKSDSLLHNMLPKHVASELKTTGKSEPKRFESMTILFTDFKGFTELVASIPAITLVEELNDIFSQFDNIMAEEGVEKIQTVGDAYLAACGVPQEDPDHAYKCVKTAQADD